MSAVCESKDKSIINAFIDAFLEVCSPYMSFSYKFLYAGNMCCSVVYCVIGGTQKRIEKVKKQSLI